MFDMIKKFSLSLGFVFLMCVVQAEETLPNILVKIDETSISSEAYFKRLIEQDDGRALENMVIEKIIELELTAKKLPQVTEQQIDAHIALMEKQLQITQGPYASINTLLQNTNMRMDDLRRKTKREIGLRRILGSSIEVKPDEIAKHYEEFKSVYTEPEARRVIAITVFNRYSPAPRMLQTDRSEAEAKEIADKIRKEWEADGGFVKTLWDTKKHFIRGYDTPYGIPVSMKEDKSFAEVFKTPIGGVTGVISDKNGLNIYKVVADLPARIVPFSEVQEQIKAELVANKIEKCIKDGEFEKIRSKYKIENYLNKKKEK
jgi:hypothetical protein